jgi:hypothetical protein
MHSDQQGSADACGSRAERHPAAGAAKALTGDRCAEAGAIVGVQGDRDREAYAGQR